MKSFNEIYEELYKKSYEELENLRKGRITKIIEILAITIIGIIILILTMEKVLFSEKSLGSGGGFLIFFEVFFITIVIFKLTISVSSKKEYIKAFKEKIIMTLVKNIDENLQYCHEKGLSSIFYRKGNFERFDEFSAEDAIEGTLDNKYVVRMAEVHTQKVEKNSDGSIIKKTLFRGIFSNVKSEKIISANIKIYSKKSFIDNFYKEKTSMEMDSTEFEKYFDTYSENRMLTMQILTADVMQILIDFRKKYSILYDLTIKENQLYIRFHTGKVFETSLFKECLDWDTIKKYYDILEFVFKLTREINKIIEETEF